ncbi:TrmH family RNA methyltransferase [Blastococcus sp. Marseille-P5729]|uniref:TrmH family RNA methyltransferase n=1 Tax=Blastococcus sp. Marseille-P5729 TaxID=2086582 RepID=UPI000D0E80DF|nr:TrmH family RNA methyltransferase [Blastococcus sp. Marseille-P5729]
MSQLRGTDLKRLHRSWKRTGPPELALVLESVASPWNVGAIVRTAAALGVTHLYLAGETASPRSAKTQKTALGTDRYLRWSMHDDGPSAIAAAQADGYHVVAVELADESTPMHQLDLRRPVALLLGHEDRGVTAAALAASDAVGFLPQVGRVGSLNVATAASIAMYEARRQHWTTLQDTPSWGPGSPDD